MLPPNILISDDQIYLA